MTSLKTVLDFLRNPYLIIVSLIAGVAFGVYLPDNARLLEPLGDAYLDLLQMVVFPFLLSAIIGSIVRIVRSEAARRYLKRLSLVYLVGMLATAALGLLLALVIKPGDISGDDSRAALGQIIVSSKAAAAADLEVSLSATTQTVDSTSAAETFFKFIPSNVFEALSTGDTLKVLVFCIFFGFAAGVSSSARGDTLSALDSVYKACQTLMRWLVYPLPIAIFVMVSAQVAKSGISYLLAMQDFLTTQLLAAALLFIISTVLICLKVKQSPLAVLKGLREPIMLAIATRSSITCIPSAIDALTKNLRAPALGTELVMPLGITIFRFGPAFYFAICAIFIAQLYGRDLGLADYIFIVIGSALAAVASTGTTSVLTISLLSLVCIPLRLPFEAALVLFIATDTITDPFRTLGIVYTNCAASVWVTGTEDDEAVLSAEGLPPPVTVQGA